MGVTKRAADRPAKSSSRRLAGPTRIERTTPASAHPATFTARLGALDERGQAWVIPDDDADEGVAASSGPEYPAPQPGRLSPLRARSTVPLKPAHVGRQVLACRANRSGQPVIIGVLTDLSGDGSPEAPAVDLVVERRRVVVCAQTELVLRCGDASITLAADGKLTIRGVDVVSSASRTQRIRGGAVRIN
jgi:hypothetical protein